MNISKTNCNIVNHANTKYSKTDKGKKQKNLNSSKDIYPAYYMDFLINNKKSISFGKSFIDIPRKPETKEDFIKGLNALNKYSQNDIKEISGFIQEILEADSWDETEEKVLFEMFTSLALSKNNSDMTVLSDIKKNITDMEQDDDYIDINTFCKGISAICSGMEYKDFRFLTIINRLMSLEDENLNSFFELLRDNIKDVNPNKLFRMLTNICRSKNKKSLEEINIAVRDLVCKYKYQDEALVNSILMMVQENTSLEDIPSDLEKRKAIDEVYSALKVDYLPEKDAFEVVFAKSIIELIGRGHTPQEIADILSHNNRIYKIMDIEGINNADAMLLADYIEDIPNIFYNEDVIREYTKGSCIFNQLLSKYNGDISKFPKSEVFETQGGKRYTSQDAINIIDDLSSILDKKALKRDMTVYRGEGFSILNQKTTPDGILLGEAIKTAINNNKDSEISDLVKQLNGEIVTQSRFMSTSYDIGGAEDFIKKGHGILWQINAPKGSKAIYCDPYNVDHGVEKEILFHKGYSMKILNAEYKNGILYLKADLLPYK